MLIEYLNKHKKRVMGDHEWTEENGHVCDVADVALIKELSTNPAYDGQFCVAPDEPLLAIMGFPKAVELLVIYGEVASVEQLAALSKEDVERLATSLLETKRTVSGWVSQAKKLVLEDGLETAVSPLTPLAEVDEKTAVSDLDE